MPPNIMVQATSRLVRPDGPGIEEASKLILAGQLVAYPTDTVYGLGCDPYNAEAVERLIQAKQRPKGELPILVNSMAAARKLGEFNKTSLALAGKYWPGPVTLLVPLRGKLPLEVTGNSQTVGLRIPKNETALNLIEKCGGAIIGTSANISGHPSARTAEDVLKDLGTSISLILDGGPTPGTESTVVRIFGFAADVVREGSVSRDSVQKTVRFG